MFLVELWQDCKDDLVHYHVRAYLKHAAGHLYMPKRKTSEIYMSVVSGKDLPGRVARYRSSLFLPRPPYRMTQTRVKIGDMAIMVYVRQVVIRRNSNTIGVSH